MSRPGGKANVGPPFRLNPAQARCAGQQETGSDKEVDRIGSCTIGNGRQAAMGYNGEISEVEP
jgi:hypothetical protein